MTRRPTPSPTALLLALLLAASGAISPLLDAGHAERETRVESTHDPSRCGGGHDHGLCRVLAGSDAAAPPGPDRGRLPDDGVRETGRRSTDAPAPPSRALPEPRGPPAAG